MKNASLSSPCGSLLNAACAPASGQRWSGHSEFLCTTNTPSALLKTRLGTISRHSRASRNPVGGATALRVFRPLLRACTRSIPRPLSPTMPISPISIMPQHGKVVSTKNPSYKAKLRAIAEDVLLSYYLEQIDISPAEAHSYFARHPDQFPAYEAIIITEIVVHNRKLAQDLRLAIAQGVNPRLLVPIFSQDGRSKWGARKAHPIYHAIHALRTAPKIWSSTPSEADGVGRKVLHICRNGQSAEGGQWDRASQRGPSGWLKKKKSVGTWLHCARNSQSKYWRRDPNT